MTPQSDPFRFEYRNLHGGTSRHEHASSLPIHAARSPRE